MASRRKYKKKQSAFVTAVQLNLETEGFEYQKWGGAQRCRRGDWIVDNGGEVYTVSRDSFARTYERVSPGVYVKSAPVWAEVATEAGVMPTREGSTEYRAGDYLVFNNEDGTDGYAMSASKFEAMYQPVEGLTAKSPETGGH